MLKFLLFIAFVVFLLGILALQVGIAYFIFWILLKAGAPKYVALMCGIGYFVIGGWVSNLMK